MGAKNSPSKTQISDGCASRVLELWPVQSVTLGTRFCGVWISPQCGSVNLSLIFLFQQVFSSCEITGQGEGCC